MWDDVVALVWRNRTPRGRVAIAVAVVLVVIGVVAPSGDPDGDDVAAQGTTSSTDRRVSTTTSTTTTRPPRSTTSGVPATTAPATSAPATTAPTHPAGVRVTSVVDGDTIRVTGGAQVRLIGIDTPERGACGYSEASAALRSLVDQRHVELVPGARDDQDRYGRLLRYVEVDGVDVNLEMIRRGHAVARYDSRDGYGRHPREDAYVAADGATVSIPGCPASVGAPTTTTAPGAPSPGGSRPDPRYGTCREAKSHGLGPYRRGVDPEYDWYRDADRDGLVCE